MTAADLSELAFEAVPFSECCPPFAPGQRVYQLRRPESGSLIVDHCFLVGDQWSVKVLDHYAYGLRPISLTAPAEYFRALPANWTEPPVCPAEGPGYDAVGDARRAELAADPEYAARIEAWRDAIAASAAALALTEGEGMTEYVSYRIDHAGRA